MTMTLQMPQIQLEDISSILQLAKTAKIEAGDAVAVGSVIERVELALAIGKLQRAAPPAEQPTEAQTSRIDRAVRKAAEGAPSP